jgi:hypothetical protein
MVVASDIRILHIIILILLILITKPAHLFDPVSVR